MVAAAPRPKAARATLLRKETAAWLLPIVEDVKWVFWGFGRGGGWVLGFMTAVSLKRGEVLT
jgi:hypothetical protein